MIRPLKEHDVDAFLGLRLEGLVDSPLAFSSSPEDERSIDSDGFLVQVCGMPESIILGAFVDPGSDSLVGIVGLYRDSHAKVAHKAHVWGMYVRSGWRGKGVGTQLMAAALDHARGLPGIEWVQLGVSAAAPAARAVYESAGFVVWGEEPDALRHDGDVTSVLYMALRLERGKDSP